MWTHIGKLQGRSGNAEMVGIYKKGSKVNIEEEAVKIVEYWGRLLEGMENTLNGWERERATDCRTKR